MLESNKDGFIKKTYSSFNKYIISSYYSTREYIISHNGNSILIFLLLVYLITLGSVFYLFIFSILSAILYLMILGNRLVDHKIEQDQLDSLDIQFYNSTKDPNLDPLDSYVDDCFTRYLVIYKGYAQGIYITDKEEKNIMKELVDSVARSISPIMRKKFEMYYGRGNMDEIMSQKCFIRVSLYVANNNKQLYVDAENTKKASDNLIKEMMIK